MKRWNANDRNIIAVEMLSIKRSKCTTVETLPQGIPSTIGGGDSAMP